jgi:hypothetical protein
MTSHANHSFHPIKQRPYTPTGAIGALVTITELNDFSFPSNVDVKIYGVYLHTPYMSMSS